MSPQETAEATPASAQESVGGRGGGHLGAGHSRWAWAWPQKSPGRRGGRGTCRPREQGSGPWRGVVQAAVPALLLGSGCARLAGQDLQG